MNLGLGLGLGRGGGNPARRIVRPFFNGIPTSGMTFTGGPNATLDNNGVLQKSYLDQPAITGGRWATTVAEGAVLGDELFTGNLTTGAGLTVVNADATHIVTFGGGGMRYQSDTTSGPLQVAQSGVLTVGKKYQFIWSFTGSGGIKTDSQTGGLNITSGVATTVTAATTAFSLLRSTTNVDVTVTAISIREVIPQYLPTSAEGADLYAATLVRGIKLYTDADPLEFKRYLGEPAATNYILWNNDFSNAAWQKLYAGTGVLPVVTPNAGIAPNGELTASRLQCDRGGSATAGDYSMLGQTITLSSSTVSSGIWVKSNTGATQKVLVYHTLSKIEVEVGSEWMRISPPSSVETNPAFRIGTRGSWGGDQTLDLLIYSAQLEKGSFSTSPITTGASAVARQATRLIDYTSPYFRSTDMGGRIGSIPEGAGQTAWLWYSYVDADNGCGVMLEPTQITFRKRAGGVNTDCSVAYTHAADTPIFVDWRTTASGGMGIRYVAWTGAAWSAWSDWVEVTTAAGKADMQLAIIFEYGSANGSSVFAGNIPVHRPFWTSNIEAYLEAA